MLQSDLWNYSDEYIVIREAVTVKTERNKAIDGTIEI